MNQRQKETQQVFLNNEKAVLKQLEGNYKDALNEINNKIAILQAREDADLQHVIYQIDYQKALKAQVQTVLDQLHNNNFETVSEYLTKSYEDGFIGTMYDLQGQGIPLVFPIDEEQVAAAIQHETKLSESLYTRLGKDTKVLSKQIAGEISRGIASSSMYSEISRNIAGYCGISKNKAMRIARTESHRIQCKATADAQRKAKEKGADVVKQWDASLDGKTRDTHRELDGQIRELDEPFEVQGMTAMQPGDFGDPAEDCNCRCALLQRARWALGNDYTKWSPDAPVEISDDGTTQFINVDAKNFTEFKGIYQDITGQMTMNMENNNSVHTQDNTHKISEKRKTSEGIFDTYNNGKGDSIRPHSIIKNMSSSEIGTNTLEYLQKENVPVKLCYGIDNPNNNYGVYDVSEDTIIVYCDKTNTIAETASTIIHEATHRKLGSKGTLTEEVECYKAECLHKKGELTGEDINTIIELVKENYPDLK